MSDRAPSLSKRSPTLVDELYDRFEAACQGR